MKCLRDMSQLHVDTHNRSQLLGYVHIRSRVATGSPNIAAWYVAIDYKSNMRSDDGMMSISSTRQT